MDRPRRSTRNSLASSSGGTPDKPSTSNPYKKPTYLSRGNGGSETPTSSRNTNGTPSSSGRGRRGRGRPPGRISVPHRGGGTGNPNQNAFHHTKPECIAVRVDGRRSTGGSSASAGGGRRGAATSGGRRSTYSSRHEYEYHYGSDFESDQQESEPEEELESEQEEDSEQDSASLAGDNDHESDSDFSVSSSRVVSSRLPSPPVPIWLDTEKVPDIPPLELPNSSDDLLLSREFVVKAVEIYEPLRRFHQLVRLSPFRFEDFCAALASDDQSSLLAEVHIQLLKCVIREEDSNGTLFGPNDVKDSIQAVVYFVDYITWPETIRSYLESDPAWKDVYEAMISVEYPFCGPAVRIKVLGWLVDQFLTTNAVREQLLGDGTILHEDHCRACNRLGELICCESCPAVYHIECLSPPLKDPDNPPDMWKCPVCMKHQVPGVNDCTSEVEKMGLLIRHERLGYDRHGRKYWFLVRRILVESEDGSEVWYYSTRGQVEDLLSQLDAANYESILVANIKSVEDEVYRQVEVTEEVTRLQNTQRRKTYLDIENGKDAEGDGPERMTRLKSTGLYKLGQENLFKTYTNHFNSDPLALGKGKQNEERDRKRHMSHKFSLTTASECKYGIKDMAGCTRQIQISALRGALTHMESVLPTTLMHVNWPMLRKTWLSGLQTGTCAFDFSRALIMISACIRNAVYNPVWSESTGHVRFSRMSLLEREERKKSEKRDKKDKDDEDDRLKGEPQFTKNPLPIRHQVYKQKGEEYRIHGRWGWIWLSTIRRCKPQDCREMGLLAGPHKHVIQVKNETGKVKTMLIDPGVYSKLMAKRNLAVTNTAGATATATSSQPATSSSSNNEPAQIPTTGSTESSSLGSNEKSENEKSEPIQTEDSSSNSSNSNKENDVEDLKTNDTSTEKEEESQPAATVEEIKVEDKNEDEGGEKEKKNEDTPKANDVDTPIEPKVEPMEVDGDSDSVQIESKKEDEGQQATPLVNGQVMEDMDQDNAEPQTEESKVEKEAIAKEKVDDVTSETISEEDEKKNQAMEVDPVKSKVQSEEMEVCSPETSSEQPCVNGVTSPQDAVDEKKEQPEVVSEEATTELKPESQSEKQVTESQDTKPAAPIASVAPSDAKADDSQGRKFKTELVNVSSGLASAHRVLYPKVARRCECLDSLLHRRLTLMSLEEKQLKSTYGEDMVNKAKSGLVQFEEEEKRRAQEAEEFPSEELVDENLTLGGAYTYRCYSSECRKEALDFMKTKGKNRERTYEKICYSPMCRLKFCLQETTRFKQERVREAEKEKYYKVYEEIEGKRQYTLEGTTHKVTMKKLPDCLTVTPATPVNGTSPSVQKKKPNKTQPFKYPQTSSFRYASSKKQSILILSPFELRRIARTAGRHFTPVGFFPNQKSGSWGWSLPCGRPVFRTAWQYKTTHAQTLGTVATQLRILYASIRWDDILAKIPNNDGRHQVHTDTEIITTEILNHRIVGCFMERVQYLRKMQVVPIDAPKTIREITPSRIGLRKRKRAESPDKTEPVVTEDWVDEEKLELWEIRFYGDRIDRKHTVGGTGRFSDSSTPSTRTKSGIAIKQPEKYDPSHNPTHSGERKTYAAHHNQATQQNASGGIMNTSSSSGTSSSSSSISDTVDSTIEHVIRNSDLSRQGDGGKTVSAVKTAELMRETIETEMKMQRAVHLSKRDSHAKQNTNYGPSNGTKSQNISTVIQQTASQQFQMQQSTSKAATSGNSNTVTAKTSAASVPPATPTTSKVGGVVVGKKFFANRHASTSASTDGAVLTKRPHQSTITICKGAGGTISVVKNNPPPPPSTPVQQQSTNPPQQPTSVQVPTTVAVATLGGQQIINTTTGPTQLPSASSTISIPPQKLSVVRLPDGRLQVKGLLPGQHCYQTADGKIHVTVSAAHVQQMQQQQGCGKQLTASTTCATSSSVTNTVAPTVTIQTPTQMAEQQPNSTTQPSVVSSVSSSAPTISVPATPAITTPVIATTGTPANVVTNAQVATNSTNGQIPVPVTGTAAPQQVIVSSPAVATSVASGTIQVHQGAQVVMSSQPSQQPVINISNQAVKSNISHTTGLVTTSGPNNKQTITIQQPQPQPQHQIIVQQPNGQQLIIQGAAAQALIQQQKLASQQRAQLVQTTIPTQQQLIKQVTTPAGQVAMKTPVVVQTSSGSALGGIVSTTATGQQVVPGRIVIQDGKAVLIGSPAATTSQQRNVIVSSKQVVGTQPAQQQIGRPQMIHAGVPGQIVQQGGAVQLIQSGQGLHLITQQQPSTQPIQQIITTATSVAGTSSSGTIVAGVQASVDGTMSSTAKTNMTISAPTVVNSTPGVATAVKHVLADGRTVLLSPSQLGDIGGRKVVLANNKIVQLPASTSTIRPTTQQQLIQSLMGAGTGGTIQIFQGPNGQQFLIQQPSTASAQQAATATMIQQAQQQQVQIVMPGGQLAGGQPLLVKKYVKATGPTTAASPSSSSSATVLGKTPTGNVVQIAATAQNQLTQLLGPNKALVRLENNQLAAIELPVQQAQTTTFGSTPAPASVVSPVVAKTSTSGLQTAPTQTATPTMATTPQQQTTITRTPGLPISIVSPSKNKVQQQSPKTPAMPLTQPTAAASTIVPSTPTGSSKTTPTVIRVSSPMAKGMPQPRSGSPASVQTTPPRPSTPTPSPLTLPSAPITPNTSTTKPPVTVSTPVIATKSVPSSIQVTSTPTGPVIISSQQQPISASSPVQPIVQQTSQPATSTSPTLSISAPVTGATTPTPVIMAAKSLPPSTPEEDITTSVENSAPPTTSANIVEGNPTTATPAVLPIQTDTPVAITSSPPQTIIQPSTTTPTVVPTSIVNSLVTSGTPPITPVIATPPKIKGAPSKIVAQIFQTAQGPKVVIQGVNPGELTQNQMMQLQQQIQRQLAAQTQQQQPRPGIVSTPITTPKRLDGVSTPAVMPPASSTIIQQQSPVVQNSIAASPVQQISTLPTILQKQQSGSPMTASSLTAQHQSPIEVLRSGPSSTSLSQLSVTSPILSRSPPPTTMVSPAKVLSPPANLPNLLSPAKSLVGKQDMVAALSSVKEPSVPGSPSVTTPPAQPVVVARKSQPRKSPIRPNNIDSPPPFMISPPPPPVPVTQNNISSVAMELMRPLSSEQQQILDDRRDDLKEDIMEKKKAAATLMRLEAQREIQEKLEKQKAIELANSKAEEQKRVLVQQHSTVNDARGAKKRKMDNNMEGSNSRSSSEGVASPASAPSTPVNSARGPRSRGGKRGKRKLLCICKTPYDKDRFYVGCDKCDNWFHGDCIGITEEMSKDLSEYNCDDCRDDKLYCMCKKPYNESQFYIQCDKCEDWFHGRCVGVLQGESDHIGDYSCPQCEPHSEINLPNGKRLDAGDYATINRLLKELLTNRASQPFRKPVTKSQAPNYFAIIKEPMDLQTVSNRVEDRQYERLREFIGDVGKIFENCRYFNDSSTDIFRHADNLEKIFAQKVGLLRQTLHSRLRQVIP